MAKKGTTATQPGGSSRRSLAAKYLSIPEEDILASKELEDGGIVVVLASGPKVRISGEQLEEVESVS